MTYTPQGRWPYRRPIQVPTSVSCKPVQGGLPVLMTKRHRTRILSGEGFAGWKKSGLAVTIYGSGRPQGVPDRIGRTFAAPVRCDSFCIVPVILKRRCGHVGASAKRPSRCWIERGRDASQVTLWPGCRRRLVETQGDFNLNSAVGARKYSVKLLMLIQ